MGKQIKPEQSIRIGSKIRIISENKEAELIGYTVGGKQKLRVEYSDGTIELRDDLTSDNIEIIQY